MHANLSRLAVGAPTVQGAHHGASFLFSERLGFVVTFATALILQVGSAFLSQ